MFHAAHRADNPPGLRLLVPGVTTWRNERAGRFAPIVDASDYFRHLRATLLEARSSVLFVGWEFDTRIRLAPDDPIPSWPDELGPFLSELVQRRPKIVVRVLQWNLGLVGTLLRGTTPLYLLNWMRARRFEFRLDSAHPTGASHHQKVVVVDDAVAFCGGIDMTDDRWDTSAHREVDTHRVRPSGRSYMPFHDATVAVDGEAAAALGELARERWLRATGERINPPAPVQHAPWPTDLIPLLTNVEIGIVRTEPAFGGRPAVNEVEKLYLAAIRDARRTIYIESQYFASRCIAEALVARLEEADPPEIVVINPDRARGWLEERAMGDARQRLLSVIAAADHLDRFRMYRPVTASGLPIYVHAKVLIVDDRLLRIGSSNINNRSMGLDTECDIAVEADGSPAKGPEIAGAIRDFRNDLLAEHLGTSLEAVAQAFRRDDSLIGVVEALRRAEGRTLIPIGKPTSRLPSYLPGGELLDPEEPEPLARAAWHALCSCLAGTRHHRRRHEPEA